MLLTFKEFLNKDDWFINRFGQSLDENFKSENAIFFSLDITDTVGTNKPKKITIFYEKLKEQKFNLYNYLASFNNKSAAKTFSSSLVNMTRGMFYYTESGFLIYVWKEAFSHYDVARALENGKSTRKLPDIDFLKLYNETYKMGKRGKFGTNWCFPAVMANANLITNIKPEALDNLLSQKKINDIFEFSPEQVDKLKSNILI